MLIHRTCCAQLGSAIVLTLMVVGCGASRQSGQAGQSPEADVQAAQEIMLLEEQWGRALSRRDTSFFRRILGDEFVTTGGAELKSKEEIIRELGAQSDSLPIPKLTSTRVRIYGDVAVVTGLSTFEGSQAARAGLTRFTEIWVRRDGTWKAVHGHYNPVESVRAQN